MESFFAGLGVALPFPMKVEAVHSVPVYDAEGKEVVYVRWTFIVRATVQS